MHGERKKPLTGPQTCSSWAASAPSFKMALPPTKCLQEVRGFGGETRRIEGKERRAWAEGIASVWRFYKATGKRKKERKREEKNETGKGRPTVWWR